MSRADRLAAAVAERQVDVLLVGDPVNLRYLTGFTGTNGAALVGAPADDRRVFLTDFRYVEQAGAQVEGFEVARGERDLLDDVVRQVAEAGVGRLGFDDVHVSVRRHARLREALPAEVELVPCGGLVEGLRAVKDEREVEAIRRAAALADEAFEAALAGGLVGRTEREVAFALEHEIRIRGGEPSFPAIVAAAENGARPHAEPRDEPIPAGTLVVVDWGAQLDGYCSDCTRTLATGDLDAEAGEVYGLVLAAQLAGLEAVAPGRTGRSVDAVAREAIEAGGHGERFGHGLGHGVGLEVHEDPRLAPKGGEAVLEVGNVVTVEPGVYVPGRFGVRIEDLVVVREGGAEVLSGQPKELRSVG